MPLGIYSYHIPSFYSRGLHRAFWTCSLHFFAWGDSPASEMCCWVLLLNRQMCQTINIPEVTCNQGWRELVDQCPSSLASPSWQWSPCEACPTQAPVGPQCNGASVALREPILVSLTAPPGTIALYNDKGKENTTTLCSALWLSWWFCMELGREKEIYT